MDAPFDTRAAHLAAHGLYNPADEHDACGVGLVAAINGKPSRAIVEMAIEALKRVWHRGAVDADGKTGDGAGLHLQIPRAFFNDHLRRISKTPGREPLAVGMLFLPKRNLAAQEEARAIVETEVLRMGYNIHGWRQVPVCAEVIGEVANDSRPEIEQILIQGRAEVDEARFELDLYFIRKRIENAARARAISQFYICSLSCRSIVYKGLFKAEQLTAFYPDLLDRRFASAYAIFHQRFSTNTAPAWHLAQPFRMLAHNGEINTLRGNVNFMKSHEATFACENFRGFEADVAPVIPDHTSDTGALDAVMEVLTRAGRPLPLSKLILIPPAWSHVPDMPEHHKHLFSFCNTVSEPWDGPAAIAASDGKWVIAGMDRGGLRPMRYAITQDGVLAIGSESGMVPLPEQNVIERGRLGPGEIIGVDLAAGKLYKDTALKDMLAAQHPYGKWVGNIISLREIIDVGEQMPDVKTTSDIRHLTSAKLRLAQIAAGLTHEEMETILLPMAESGKEAVGSMGDDTAIAILSDRFRPFHHFFRQNFSQVTNPPIDSLRERGVMSLFTRFGNDGNYLALDSSHSRTLLCETPVLLSHEMSAIEAHFADKITRLDALFDAQGEGNRLRRALDKLVQNAEYATRMGKPCLLLSDENMSASRAAIPMILAVSAVHSHLVRCKLRKRASIVVRTSQCWEPHALAVLIGCGATVVNPYMAEAIIRARSGNVDNYRNAMANGLLKIMSKMGISVVSSYRGGLNFEAIGLSRALVAEFFPGLPSRISGIGLGGIEKRALAQHAMAYGSGLRALGKEFAIPKPQALSPQPFLPLGGYYRSRAREEHHAWEGRLVHLLQSAVGKNSYALYKEYSNGVHAAPPLHLRDLLEFRATRKPIARKKVEPVKNVLRRFVAPAMSLGALSPEAHETLAVAMHRIGAASNSGEGGEGPERYGTQKNSDIKQVASARFGVTIEYLNAATELQIKIAQGAKPGEGGQLPGFKVTQEIARLRHATPGVMLISPPPHHDIYSIEDLAQLIYDLKQANPRALVSVKLVAQAGIGTIASGVAKAMADKIVIAGGSGGTGASPWSSIKHAGIPWEMGLAEANQVLTLNRLRHRVKLQTDGGLKTGRDIVIAAMLGAEEFALGTASLVAMGCLLVRQCHSNTCPVGITTQDPKLRDKFDGTVEKVVNLFTFVAEEVREILAALGFSSLDEIVGRADLLMQVNRGGDDLVDLDLNNLLAVADAGGHARHFSLRGRNEVPDAPDARITLPRRKAALRFEVNNTMRAIGTRLSSKTLRRRTEITLKLHGSAGQSLGAFLARGLRIDLTGDANDYVGKGLSGGSIVIRPRDSKKSNALSLRYLSALPPHENTIIGNTVLYGATSGELFASGQAGERFAVRNSGAIAVAEGCGSNGCEYMTGGVAVLLGETGYNFAAGMTGGMAFVYDAAGTFPARLNTESALAQRLENPQWEDTLKTLIRRHADETGSPRAKAILANWEQERLKFWQVCPKEMAGQLTIDNVQLTIAAHRKL